MGLARAQDLVTFKGTEVQLQAGNGWTAWNVSWDEFVKGSALPVSTGLGPAPVQAPHPGAVAGGSPGAVPSVAGG